MNTAIEYNADCIRVLRPDEVEEKFEWMLVQDLANEYKCSPTWIARGFEACWRSGVDKEYFIQRYLEKDPCVAPIALVGETFMELLSEMAGGNEMSWKIHYEAENIFSASTKKEGGYEAIESERRKQLWLNAVKLATKRNNVFEVKNEKILR